MDDTIRLIFVAPAVNVLFLAGQHFARDRFRLGDLQSGFPVSSILYYLMLLTFSGFIVQFFIYFIGLQKIPYYQLLLATCIFALFLFIVLSEALIVGLGRKLTGWRGEKWVKEIDYVYLFLGAVGLAMSINRLENIDQKLSFPEFYGPFILATALVLRGIKTRAEINGWNKATKSRRGAKIRKRK
jgi:hypothetical protein